MSVSSLRRVLPVAARGYSTAMSSAVRAKGGANSFVLLAGAGVAGATATAGSYYITSESSAATVNYEAVRAEIEKTIDAEEERREDGTSIGPTYVRLAWHCAGTYSKDDKTGGSVGCRMRFNPEAGWGANAGLGIARISLEPIKTKFPTISYADLYTFAGKVAVEKMSGPDIPWTSGRPDFTDGTTSPPDGRLPNADMGSPVDTAQHLRDIFYRMGFDDKDIVALSGAHALGRCHEDASGFWGPWTFAETTFSNEYFRLLVEEKWTPKKTHTISATNDGSCPWKGPGQYEDKTGKLMMLPSDIVLTQDAKFKEYVALYAKDEEAFFKDFAAAFSKLLALGFDPKKPPAAGGDGGLLAKIKGMLGL